ncbi:uncharacterized protein PFL1_00240 [Pseudozyma flocculosa PF-1]|uniref:uncharacterized protein n=1 Tax=Pseudozyma flocculosa PF-1 TaxID=1277687 RepID=UPI0004560354|nr:uncharacterized protein PFL1_00240 [Pseudozyma flocculosa PF-1]EPQ32042.1 hypothetical protein PFL1_00240 [Pseudozyma flocculosa PF-1]
MDEPLDLSAYTQDVLDAGLAALASHSDPMYGSSEAHYGQHQPGEGSSTMPYLASDHEYHNAAPMSQHFPVRNEHEDAIVANRNALRYFTTVDQGTNSVEMYMYVHPTCFKTTSKHASKATPAERDLVLFKLRRDLTHYPMRYGHESELARIQWIDSEDTLLERVDGTKTTSLRYVMRVDYKRRNAPRGPLTRYLINEYTIMFRKPQTASQRHFYVLAIPSSERKAVIEVGVVYVPEWAGRTGDGYVSIKQIAHPPE